MGIMLHSMTLRPQAFDDICLGSKRIEIRLDRGQAKRVKVGDTVVFLKLPKLKDTIKVKVVKVLPFKTFKDLIYFSGFKVKDFGSRYSSRKAKYAAIYRNVQAFTKANERKFGVLAFRLQYPIRK